jgi:hypothetical protein
MKPRMNRSGWVMVALLAGTVMIGLLGPWLWAAVRLLLSGELE